MTARVRALAAAALLAACDDPAPLAAGAECAVGAIHAVGEATGPALHGLALARLDGGDALALWSDAVGTHARRLAPGGAPREPARRVGAPCTGGLATTPAAPDDGGAWLACLEAAAPAKDRPAWVRLARVTGAGAIRPTAAVEAGPATEVSVGLGEDGAPRVGWAVVGAQWLWEAAAPDRGADALPRPGAFPRGPAFAAGGARFWTERRVDGLEADAALLGVRSRGAAERLGDANGEPGGASAADHPSGGVVVVWRHEPDRWAVPWLWARRFDASLRPLGEAPVRVARSGVGGAVHVRACLGGFVAVTPHRDGSVSSSLALRRLDGDDLAPLAPELAIFEQAVDWTESDARCSDAGDRLDLLLGERARTGRGAPRVVATSFTCPLP